MYFDGQVQIKQERKNGSIKKDNVYYLLEAVSYTDAEKKITKLYFGVSFDWEIKSIKKSRISEIIN